MPSANPTDPAPLLPGPLAILLVPQFTMIALSSIVEPLRIANRYVERPYRWHLVSVDGEPVADRNGIKVAVDAALGEIDKVGTLIAVADVRVSQAFERLALPQLRRLARAGAMMGGVDTGAMLLARAGLLDGCRATAHWEVTDTFREQFPHVEVSSRLYEIDRNRATCAGGAAVLDLMLKEIETSFGRQLAVRVSEHCMHGRPRPAIEEQRVSADPSDKPFGKKLNRAIQLMEETTRPARVDAVARAVGVSRRQLHRIFAEQLATSPTRFRLKLKLEQARHLLVDGGASVTEAALAAGFASRSYFSRCYRREFGRPPRRDRP